MSKNVIVFGGTGHQGQAFVNALAAQNKSSANPVWTIHLLARNPEAPSAERLARLNGVKIVHSPHYMESPDEAFDAAGLEVGHVYGAFLVCGYMDGEKEVAQGVRVIKSAAAHGVKHIVFASVMFDESKEFGDDGMDPKRDIERAIKETNMKWTMLRSCDFMDNWLPTDGTIGRVWRTILLNKAFKNHPDRALPMVATRDIGRVGALAMTSGDKYLDQAIPVVGDLLTIPQIKEIYFEVMGTDIVQSWGITTSIALWSDANTAKLAKFYDSDQGFGDIDLSLTKDVLPDIENFRTFLERYKREQAVAKAMA
ncbi:hypothetical protein CcaverHIS002_0305750 [Cutaneotrichosporon cavernicola]|uniref:NmrA-like domain-containing protein n=1 Tax=Cutaneotrichosporon cavernicola TaxID=279322 RepID=A0AA48L0Y0_9TREE|nr:uncharacterized protein CcaverHIS019_0305710 [Cutaneotrichosporon cavernicola]BEI82707.1 hypothetical protein CcaverHIS002_0305750 [Cutaneotrichosporon cavernicola]BEI90501.1 hypothetical protein CcaverHIS019_0305710 [Cutaneotrichosporon cavernicola]BEI98275.1 hypothetical protein CcaverHIS631_0305740 [Cutaneotrichosporon cavernicola]BEJ06050.1 hypothetical protein CcaverHIS641_0305720 [Cutaneotrichosporon cavernicola]